MEPTAAQIHELKCKFFDKLESEHGSSKGYFHTADMAKILNSDNWLKRFLLHHELNMKDAFKMLWNTCEWRKEMKVNEINEQTLKKEYLEAGIIFPHKTDKDGMSILIIKGKKYNNQQDHEELKRLFIYWFERAERQDNGKQISFIIDRTDCGIMNVELKCIEFLMKLLSDYYPDFVNYILVFESPWIVTPALKLITCTLPKNVLPRIKYVTRKTLFDYVDEDQALACFGGYDDYTYTFEPEHSASMTIRLEDSKKKVHFADGSPLVEVAPSSFNDVNVENSSPSISKLKVSPADCVLFSQDGSDLIGNINLLNTNEKPVAFKIKTTSPDKYKVRPSTGLLQPNDSTIVSLILQQGHQAGTIARDKFLVMSFALDDNDIAPAELADIWKASDSKNVDQLKLRCMLSGQSTSASHNGVPGTPFRVASEDVEWKINQMLIKLNHLAHCNNQLELDLRFSNRMHVLSFLMLLIIVCAFVYVIHRTPQELGSPTSCFKPPSEFGDL